LEKQKKKVNTAFVISRGNVFAIDICTGTMSNEDDEKWNIDHSTHKKNKVKAKSKESIALQKNSVVIIWQNNNAKKMHCTVCDIV